jgi:hypothetical protein
MPRESAKSPVGSPVHLRSGSCSTGEQRSASSSTRSSTTPAGAAPGLVLRGEAGVGRRRCWRTPPGRPPTCRCRGPRVHRRSRASCPRACTSSRAEPGRMGPAGRPGCHWRPAFGPAAAPHLTDSGRRGGAQPPVGSGRRCPLLCSSITVTAGAHCPPSLNSALIELGVRARPMWSWRRTGTTVRGRGRQRTYHVALAHQAEPTVRGCRTSARCRRRGCAYSSISVGTARPTVRHCGGRGGGTSRGVAASA